MDFVRRTTRDPQPETDIVGDSHIREERIRLEHHANVAPVGRHIGHIDAVDDDPPRCRLFKPRNHAQRRRFAAPRRSQERNELTLLDCQGEVFNGNGRSKTFVHMNNLKNCHTSPD